jgi:flagellar basal-body rod modification protein FlgD
MLTYLIDTLQSMENAIMLDINAMNNQSLNQTNFLKLFMEELSYQDPLKPIDNREFMVQMAQFSALTQLENNNQVLEKTYGILLANQALSLLNKQITTQNNADPLLIRQIIFENDKPPMLKAYPNGVEKTISLDTILSVS